MLKTNLYRKLISFITLSALGLALFTPAVTQSRQIQPQPIQPVVAKFAQPAQVQQTPPDLGLVALPTDNDSIFTSTTNYAEYPNDDFDRPVHQSETPKTLNFHVKIDRY